MVKTIPVCASATLADRWIVRLLGPARCGDCRLYSLGTFTTPSLSTGGITVTGSAAVSVLNLNGLGIVGGSFGDSVD